MTTVAAGRRREETEGFTRFIYTVPGECLGCARQPLEMRLIPAALEFAGGPWFLSAAIFRTARLVDIRELSRAYVARVKRWQ